MINNSNNTRLSHKQSLTTVGASADAENSYSGSRKHIKSLSLRQDPKAPHYKREERDQHGSTKEQQPYLHCSKDSSILFGDKTLQV